MPVVNRYTQIPQPLLLNPLSFEELSRVPLAKAQATAEGVSALNRVQTDYNVDDKDLGYITNLINGIDDNKNKLVENIATSGVSNQTVNDIVNLKRTRDNLYKTQVNQAEENKKRIDMWRQTVDQLYAKESPAYADYMKKKELDKWGGTFASGDSPQTFVGTYGPKYFDVKDDIFREMSQAKEMTELSSKYRAAGSPTEVQRGQMSYIYTSGEYSKQELSNKYKLLAVRDRLKQEYKDRNTERGKFKEYAEMSDEEIDYQLDAAYAAYLQEMTREQGGGGSYSGGTPVQQPTSPYTPYDKTPLRPSNFQMSDVVKEGQVGVTSKIFEGGKEAVKSAESGNMWNPFSKAYRGIKGFIKGFSGADVPYEKKMSVIKNFPETINQLLLDGKISEKTYTFGKQGMKGYVDDLINAVSDFQDDLQDIELQPTVAIGDALQTMYGKLLTGINPAKAATDSFIGNQPLYEVRTRKPIKLDKDEIKEYNVKADKGEIYYKGNVTMLSPDLLDEDGNYVEGMTSAYYMRDSEGNEFYRPLPEYLKQDPEYKRIDRINKRGVTIKPGEVRGGFYIPDVNGKWKEVQMRHSDLHRGEFQLIIDNKLYELNDPQNSRLFNVLEADEMK